MLNFSCKSLHAFYFCVKQFCVLITVNQWHCQRCDGHVSINLSLFGTRISLVNIVTQKCTVLRQSTEPNYHTMSTVLRN